MVLVTSLLEMKRNDNVVKRIIRSLPIEILKKNMSDLYKRYKKNYGLTFTNESLKHVFNFFILIILILFIFFLKKKSQYEGDPRDKNCKNSENYYELIIEAGFLAYFLLNEYLEIINDDELESNLFTNKAIKENNFFQNSLIGQIGSLLVTVVKFVWDTLKNYKNEFKNYWEMRKSTVPVSNEFKTLKLQKQRLKESWRFFGKNSAHIEILRNDDVEKVYFILNPFCQFLPLVKIFQKKLNQIKNARKHKKNLMIRWIGEAKRRR